jgi:hypothetical protein
MSEALVSLLGGLAGGIGYSLWRAWQWDREIDAVLRRPYQRDATPPIYSERMADGSVVWRCGTGESE